MSPRAWLVVVAVGSAIMMAAAKSESNGEAVKRGQAVFAQQCQMCHPNGDAGVGPSLKLTKMDDAALRKQIRLGTEAMPEFKKDKIDDAALADLLSYLHTLKNR